jgi:Bacterial regulatory protein, Fis family
MRHPTMAPPHPHAGDLEVLAAWAPELADTFVALACDIALVIDAEGRIVTFAQRDERPIAPRSWIGRMWSQTVDADSRPKVEAMLADVAEHGVARRREINHRAGSRAVGGTATPVAYSAARLGAGGPTLAVGQDLRGQSALQQRFVAAQEALERSYWHAQRQLREPPSREASAAGMTDDEREALGLDAPLVPTTHDLDDSELVRALGRLVDRIDHDTLPGLLRDARRLAEGHFIARALARAGSVDALARTLGVSRRSLVRRRKTQKS